MKKTMKNVLVGSALAAGLFHSAHWQMTRYLVKVALDRELPFHLPGAEKRLSGTLPDPVAEARLQAAGELLKAKPHETVQISAHDGARLIAHWFPKPGAKRVILAMHGWRSCWYHDFGLAAEFFFREDCSLLLPEQRGQGSSGGECMAFGLLERFDCVQWLSWLEANGWGNLPTYLFGISMGAATVLMAAGSRLPENVRGIIADCGYTSAGAVWKHVASQNLGLNYRRHRLIAETMFRKHLHMGLDSYSCPRALRRCSVPVLFIHGDADNFVPVEMTRVNFAACTAPKQLLIVPGAGHGMSFFRNETGYCKAIIDFWEQWDNPPVGNQT